MGLIPAFARPIVEARRSGKRPSELVIVSDGAHGLHRKVPNPVVCIGDRDNPQRFDWRFLADLDVEIATRGDGRRIDALVAPILAARPFYLRVWRLDTGALTRIRWLGLTRVMPETRWECADAAH